MTSKPEGRIDSWALIPLLLLRSSLRVQVARRWRCQGSRLRLCTGDGAGKDTRGCDARLRLRAWAAGGSGLLCACLGSFFARASRALPAVLPRALQSVAAVEGTRVEAREELEEHCEGGRECHMTPCDPDQPRFSSYHPPPPPAAVLPSSLPHHCGSAESEPTKYNATSTRVFVGWRRHCEGASPALDANGSA
uniref:Uncharacterized protein n=1 Tax=Mycena chlorophos TaxID=658473 RepID=A0ABQ0KZA4_MYCCL|nr:predicted protein [Mycena chlorophos]